MKIAIFNTWYYPNMMGGAEHSVKILAENLAKMNNQVYVFTVDSQNKNTKYEKINGVNVYRLYSGNYRLFEAYDKKYSGFSLYLNKFHELFNNSIKPEMNKLLRKIQPDIVHVNSFSGLSFSSVESAYKQRIPIVFTLRNYFMLNPTNKEMPKFLTSVYQKITRKFSNYATAVTAPSNFTLNEHLKSGLFNTTEVKDCIPNCITIPCDETQQEILRKKNKKEAQTKFIYAGWLSEDKGIRHLLDAFNQLKSNASLTLCGDGDLRNLVIKAAKENPNIKYLGKLRTEDLYHQYSLADVGVVPSIWDEPFGRVVIEANAFGLPVIASNKGGIPEIIDTMHGGQIYQAGDVNQLKHNMEKMCDTNYRVKFLDNILQNIDKYSAEEQAKRFMSLYNQSLSMDKKTWNK